MLKRTVLRTSAASAAALLALSLAACSSDDRAADSADDPAATSSAPAAGGATSCAYPQSGQAAKKVEQPAGHAVFNRDVPVTLTLEGGKDAQGQELALTLHGATAPCTVNSFTSLVQQGYFDKTPCHRLTTQGIDVLQCGDPTGTGSGGPGYSFDDEVKGNETYPAGTLAMANAGPNTNGSQFFICYQDVQLPPSYTVFGQVDQAGLEVVRAIAAKGTDDSNGPGDGAPKEKVGIARATLS